MKQKLTLIAAALGMTLALTPAWAAPTVYIPLGSANKVIAVDAATSKITQTYTGVDNPHGLVATPDGEYLVTGSLTETPAPAGSPADTPTSKLFVIHPVHGHVMSTIPMVGWTHHQTITSDGRYVVSTHPTRGGISVADLTTNKVVHTVATGPSPNYAVFTPDNKRMYVTNTGNGTISEIDAVNWKVIRTLDAGPSPEHLVLAADGKRLFVSGDRSGKVSEVSIETGKVLRDFQMGKRLHGLDISDDGKWLFISVLSDDKLVALDPQTGVRRVLPLAPAPYHLGTVHGTGKLYVSSRKEPKIWVVDQTSLKLLDTIALPGGEGHEIGVVN